MSERPIIFSGPMVRTLLEGRKWQTRRVVKGRALDWLDSFAPDFVADPGNMLSPYGYPGDHLWVRETWGALFTDPPGTPGGRKPQPGDDVRYRADPGADYQWRDGSLPWRPSIHMPRWACRIHLQITGLRIERLQSITPDDAQAEGLWRGKARRHLFWLNVTHCRLFEGMPHHAVFAQLWDDLNADRGHGWSTNPWVWVISFEPLVVAPTPAGPA